jgi:hypothetical protein
MAEVQDLPQKDPGQEYYQEHGNHDCLFEKRFEIARVHGS